MQPSNDVQVFASHSAEGGGTPINSLTHCALLIRPKAVRFRLRMHPIAHLKCIYHDANACRPNLEFQHHLQQAAANCLLEACFTGNSGKLPVQQSASYPTAVSSFDSYVSPEAPATLLHCLNCTHRSRLVGAHSPLP